MDGLLFPGSEAKGQVPPLFKMFFTSPSHKSPSSPVLAIIWCSWHFTPIWFCFLLPPSQPNLALILLCAETFVSWSESNIVPPHASGPANSERDVLREDDSSVLAGVRHPVCTKAAGEAGTMPRVSDGKEGN